MLPVVDFELQSLSTTMADKLWEKAEEASKTADLGSKPMSLKVKQGNDYVHVGDLKVGGLLEVWITHAADNFSVL
jgi:hypothetical protein